MICSTVIFGDDKSREMELKIFLYFNKIRDQFTSGKPSYFGQVSSFQLPVSGLKIYYSTKFFRRTYIYEKTLEPDVKISLSMNDFRRGVDLLLEWIKKQ